MINNFEPPRIATEADVPDALARRKSGRRVIYAGNLGRFQNVEPLVEGVLRALGPDDELLLLGDGAARAGVVRSFGQDPRLRVHDFIPLGAALQVISQSDVGLLSLAPGIYRYAYPSKFMAYISAGVPVMAMVEPESDLARTIVEENLGAVAQSPTAGAVATAMRGLLAELPSRTRLQAWHRDTHGQDIALSKWRGLIDAA